jgi:hypothetical protein
MNSNTKRIAHCSESNAIKSEKTRLAQVSKYSANPMAVRVAAMRPKSLVVYSEDTNSIIPLINHYRRKLCRWRDIQAPQKIVAANAAMLELKSSGYDILTLTFHLSDRYKKMVKKNARQGVECIPESISNCLKSCLRDMIFGGIKNQPIYLFFALEDLYRNPHGHGAFLVPSNWRIQDRDSAIHELEVAIKRALCHDYRGRGNNKPVEIASTYESGEIIKPVDLGWGTYVAKSLPKKVYLSDHLSKAMRGYYEALRKPIIQTTTNQ